MDNYQERSERGAEGVCILHSTMSFPQVLGTVWCQSILAGVGVRSAEWRQSSGLGGGEKNQ